MSFSPVSEVPVLMTAVAVSLTGTTTETSMATATIKAGSAVAGDILVGYVNFSYPSSANQKTLRVKLSGVEILLISPTTTASVMRYFWMPIVSLTSQMIITNTSVNGIGTSATALLDPAVNFGSDVTLDITGRLASAAETLILEQAQFRIMKAPL